MKMQIFFTLAGLAFAAMQGIPANGQTAERTNLVKPVKFQRLMKKKNVVVIDVRTAEEFMGSHIPGAIQVSIKDTTAFVSKLHSLGKSKKYLLYCGTSRRSQAALDIMKGQGFKKVVHLEGGIENWKGKPE